MKPFWNRRRLHRHKVTCEWYGVKKTPELLIYKFMAVAGAVICFLYFGTH